MNTAPRTEFVDEELVAFICGAGSQTTNADIQRALKRDEDLQAHMAFLCALMPHAQRDRPTENLSELPEGSVDTVNLASVEETVAQTRESESDANQEPQEMAENLRVVAALDRQGLTASEIGERTGATQTLVELKLRRIRKLGRKSCG